MAITNSDVILTHPIFHPPDHTTKLGGGNSFNDINHTEVNSVFMPGMIKSSDDFSDVNYDQYSKIFLFNKSFTDTAYDTRIYGYNIANNIVKMALEKDSDGNPILDGEETIANRLTAPSLYGEYNFSEIIVVFRFIMRVFGQLCFYCNLHLTLSRLCSLIPSNLRIYSSEILNNA